MDRLPISEVLNLPSGTVFLDVDGTLLPDGTNTLSQDSKVFINEIRNKHSIVLSSNSNKKNRTELLGKELNLPILKNKKPSMGACVEARTHKMPFIVVGDKWWTDGIFAKKINGMYFQVKPLRAKSDGLTMIAQYWINYLTSNLFPISSLFVPRNNKIK